MELAPVFGAATVRQEPEAEKRLQQTIDAMPAFFDRYYSRLSAALQSHVKGEADHETVLVAQAQFEKSLWSLLTLQNRRIQKVGKQLDLTRSSNHYSPYDTVFQYQKGGYKASLVYALHLSRDDSWPVRYVDVYDQFRFELSSDRSGLFRISIDGGKIMEAPEGEAVRHVFTPRVELLKTPSKNGLTISYRNEEPDWEIEVKYDKAGRTTVVTREENLRCPDNLISMRTRQAINLTPQWNALP